MSSIAIKPSNPLESIQEINPSQPQSSQSIRAKGASCAGGFLKRLGAIAVGTSLNTLRGAIHYGAIGLRKGEVIGGITGGIAGGVVGGTLGGISKGIAGGVDGGIRGGILKGTAGVVEGGRAGYTTGRIVGKVSGTIVGGMGMAIVGAATGAVTAFGGCIYTSLRNTSIEKCTTHVQNPQDALKKLEGPKTAKDIMGFLPQNMDDSKAHAILCGAHVVFSSQESKNFINGLTRGNLPHGVTDRTGKTSHYNKTTQFGCDIEIKGTPCHILFGKTDKGNLFMQLEKSSVVPFRFGQIMKATDSGLSHLVDWSKHKASGNAQVGPFGMVDSSEKNKTELIVSNNEINQRVQ